MRPGERAIHEAEEAAILKASTPLWISEERTLVPGDTFKVVFEHPGPVNITARWILVSVDAPALTPNGHKIR